MQPDPLRQAATVLLAAVPDGAVIAAVQVMINAWKPPAQSSPAQRRATQARPADPVEAQAWRQLCEDVRVARRKRGLSFDQLAREVNVAPTTIRSGLSSKRMPSRPFEQRTWLARQSTQEVVSTPPQPFPVERDSRATATRAPKGTTATTARASGNGAASHARAGHGHGHTASTRNGAAA
jgi:hypothetical protein